MRAVLAFLTLTIFSAFVAACSSLITPRLDERTGTTLAQRCVDYRGTVAALDVALLSRELSDREQTLYELASLYVAANCPIPAPQPAE